MPYMYILECADNSYYVGSTWNIERRLSQHNAGGAQNTRAHVTQCASSTWRSTR
ncbi:GIY-YIG nuclease family protein [Cryobacterium sp. TMT3-29-2]|uniref:GIY-YIG nuclease family protein n=1 Tax=Cryobacterium sp. TMT3-29-2 TaxID=2555867 RepID=UPI0018E066F5